MNANDIIAYHVQMAKIHHRYIIPILRRRENNSLMMYRKSRDEHLAMAREVKRLSQPVAVVPCCGVGCECLMCGIH